MKNNNELQELRNKIDEIDKQIITLLSLRFIQTRKVGIVKKKHGLNSVDVERFKEILEKWKKQDGSISSHLLEDIFLSIHEEVVKEHNSTCCP